MAYDIQPRASHYVAGEYIDDAAGAEIPVIYAATGERVATLHAATPAIVERALAAAETAQAEWATWSPRERGRVLTRAAQIMRERNHDLSVLETYDTGKPLQFLSEIQNRAFVLLCRFWCCLGLAVLST